MNFDAAYMRVFSFPEVVRDLMLGFHPDSWVRKVDFDTLTREQPPLEAPWQRRDRERDPNRVGEGPPSSENSSWGERDNAVVWRAARIGYRPGSIRLMLQFEAEQDWRMALFIMRRVLLLIDVDPLVTEVKDASNPPLAPVAPFVLYNGGRRWTAKKNVKDLIARGPAEADDYRPSAAHEVIEEMFCPVSESGVDNIAGMMFRAQRTRTATGLLRAIRDSEVRIRKNPDLERAIVAWLLDVVLSARAPDINPSEISDLDDLKRAIVTDVGQQVKAAEKEAFERAKRLAILDGLRNALRRLARGRFGEKGEAELAALTTSVSSVKTLHEIGRWIRTSRNVDELRKKMEDTWLPTVTLGGIDGSDVQ